MVFSEFGVVDELLATPQYGQRWARHWLDVARFAERHGYEQDYDRPFAYHYRDYVIRALNDDQPFDEFVRWQIAGDELAPDSPRAWFATGFLGPGVEIEAGCGQGLVAAGPFAIEIEALAAALG